MMQLFEFQKWERLLMGHISGVKIKDFGCGHVRSMTSLGHSSGNVPDAVGYISLESGTRAGL